MKKPKKTVSCLDISRFKRVKALKRHDFKALRGEASRRFNAASEAYKVYKEGRF